jgi:secondary thiamine-phosphate synthase enzyme
MNITIKTKGQGDIVDITSDVAKVIELSGISDGIAIILVGATTAAITTMENEKGAKTDLLAALNKIAPATSDYEHHKKWQDHNGAAHIKSAIIGTQIVVPVSSGKLELGTWQEIVLIDFDERPRDRQLAIKLMSTDD